MPGDSKAFSRLDLAVTIVQTRFYRHRASPRVPGQSLDMAPPICRPTPLFRQPEFGTVSQSLENARGNYGRGAARHPSDARGDIREGSATGALAANPARCGGDGAKAESSGAGRESKCGSGPRGSNYRTVRAAPASKSCGLGGGTAREPGSLPRQESSRFPSTLRTVLALPGRLQRFRTVVGL